MPISDRLNWAWRRLGLESAVLLAALLGDLLIVFPAAFDDFGPKGRDLYLLPGIVAMFACGLWAKRRPATAAFAAAAALVGSTALIRLTGTSSYSTLLNSLSLTETVAGIELVVATVRRERPVSAFMSTAALTFGALFAVILRPEGAGHLTARFEATFGAGALILAGAVAVGVRLRGPQGQRPQHSVTRLVLGQWPLIGMLCLPLFLELSEALNRPLLFPLLLCSVVAAVLAVYAVRAPVLAAVLMSGVVLASGAAGGIATLRPSLPLVALPPTQVLAGMAIVVFLVRQTPPAQAISAIALLTVAVGINVVGTMRAVLGSLFVVGLLLLGISAAIGLYFRARDSERARVVEAAVTEAQTSERMALARELHDVVAHHVTGIVVQAQAARLIGGKNPALAMEALDRIEEAGTEALVAMRRLVRSMRGSTDTTEQATTDLEADLRRLVEAGHHGIPTEIDLRIPADIPQEVARSALRLVQESLTNVGKHAPTATHVHVLVETVDDELHIRVRNNDGCRVDLPAGGSGGYGLVGMRERVELLHGRLTAGPVDGGWLVEAWLPLRGIE